MRNKLIIIKDICKIIISVLIIIAVCKSCANAKILTDVEIKNFILNGYEQKINSSVPTNIQNNVLNANWTSWINLMQTNEGHYGLQLSSNGQQAILYIISGSESNLENYFPYSNGSAFLVNTNYIRTDYYSFNLTSGGFGNKTNASGWLFSNPRTWWYTDTNIKTNSSNQTKNGTNLYTAPYSDPENAFAENWVSNIKWELTPNSNNPITIPNRNGTHYALNKGSFKTTLATLQDSSYTDQIFIKIRAWNGTNWELVNDKELFNYKTQIMSDTFPSTTTNDIMTSSIQVNSRQIPTNVIIQMFIYPQQTFINEYNLQELEQFYYITDSKSVINSGVLDITATFSGDTEYENQVNNAIDNEQDQQQIDQNNEMADWWKTTYDNMFKINSGDINDYVQTITNAVPVESGELEEIYKIFDYISGDPRRF